LNCSVGSRAATHQRQYPATDYWSPVGPNCSEAGGGVTRDNFLRGSMLLATAAWLEWRNRPAACRRRVPLRRGTTWIFHRLHGRRPKPQRPFKTYVPRFRYDYLTYHPEGIPDEMVGFIT